MLELIIVAFISFYMGAKLKGIFMIVTFRKLLRDLGISDQHLRDFALKHGIELPDETPSENSAASERDVIEVKIEQHQGQLYAFRMDNDQFLGQGTDAQGLINRLNETMKPCRVLVPKDHGADLLKDQIG